MKHKLLIVDDDTNLLSVLKGFFTDEACTVTTCSNGVEAVRLCKDETFDLVITDIMMPAMNGLEVLKEIRKVDSGILVILITGFASLETAIEAIREGAYDYITKPFKLEELKIAVRNATEKIRLVRENRRLIQELQGACEELRVIKGISGSPDEKESGREREEGLGEERTFIAGDVLPFHHAPGDMGRRASFISDLERVSRLRDKGFISEREFELCKSRLFQPLK